MNTNPSITNIRQHLQDLQDYISYLEDENSNLREVIQVLTDGKGDSNNK